FRTGRRARTQPVHGPTGLAAWSMAPGASDSTKTALRPPRSRSAPTNAAGHDVRRSVGRCWPPVPRDVRHQRPGRATGPTPLSAARAGEPFALDTGLPPSMAPRAEGPDLRLGRASAAQVEPGNRRRLD